MTGRVAESDGTAGAVWDMLQEQQRQLEQDMGGTIQPRDDRDATLHPPVIPLDTETD